MQVKFRKVSENGELPKYSNLGDAAMDIMATEFFIDEMGNYCYKTGIAYELTENFVCLLFPRSSIAKYDLVLANSVGVLDSGFRGEIMVKFKATKINPEKIYNVGDRIAQIMIIPIPKIEPIFVDEIENTIRGQDGFGSTGN